MDRYPTGQDFPPPSGGWNMHGQARSSAVGNYSEELQQAGQSNDPYSENQNQRRTTRGAWSPEEDAILVQAVQIHGSRWSLVSGMVRTRSSTQCARRWCDTLDPKIDKSPWTPEQDQILLQAVSQYGRTWASIAKSYFPGRTGLALKNRYTVIGKPRNPHSRSLSPPGTSPYSSYPEEQWGSPSPPMDPLWNPANTHPSLYAQSQSSSSQVVQPHSYPSYGLSYPVPADPRHTMPYPNHHQDSVAEAYMQGLMHSPDTYM